MASRNASDQRRIARRLVDRHGRTFAAEAGITLRNEPAPLWQLLVLSLLMSTRISSDIALATARELWSAGWRTPDRLLGSSWQERVDALGRGGYRRYDESTATRLDHAASLLDQRWGGDLRKLRAEAESDAEDSTAGEGDDPESAARAASRASKLLQGFEGIGPTGASIFLREVQLVWPGVRPFADKLALKGAAAAGLPEDPNGLAGLVDGQDLAALDAALVRIARDPGLLDDI
jgi:hypothetical protein